MIDNWQVDHETAGRGDEANQHLCFWLGTQVYALPVTGVQEIRAVGSWSALPGSPAWVLGAMNLRGLIIPLLDLRTRFALQPAAQTAAPVLIVISDGGKLAGLVVDGVMDLISLAQPSLRQEQAADLSGEARCVAGVASLGESVVIVLDNQALMVWEAEPAGGGVNEIATNEAEAKGVQDVAMV